MKQETCKNVLCTFFFNIYQRQIIYIEFLHTYTKRLKAKNIYRHSNTKQQIYSHTRIYKKKETKKKRETKRESIQQLDCYSPPKTNDKTEEIIIFIHY